MSFEQKIELKQIDESDHDFLYKLLENRNLDANISHKSMPTYDEHVKFVLSEPYSVWYVILINGEKSGSIYLSKQDEIGIFLSDDVMGKGIGNIVLQLLMEKNSRSRYLANVNPNNKKSLKFFEKNNFQLIQYTYEFTNKTLK
jgi:RimJ/RimL family protein N-acetyltransferase